MRVRRWGRLVCDMMRSRGRMSRSPYTSVPMRQGFGRLRPNPLRPNHPVARPFAGLLERAPRWPWLAHLFICSCVGGRPRNFFLETKRGIFFTTYRCALKARRVSSRVRSFFNSSSRYPSPVSSPAIFKGRWGEPLSFAPPARSCANAGFISMRTMRPFSGLTPN